jgi:hypothetical protein
MSKSFIALAALVVAGLAIGDSNMADRMGGLLIDLVYLRPGSRKQEAEVCPRGRVEGGNGKTETEVGYRRIILAL